VPLKLKIDKVSYVCSTNTCVPGKLEIDKVSYRMCVPLILCLDKVGFVLQYYGT
jgi:hypothetical protein